MSNDVTELTYIHIPRTGGNSIANALSSDQRVSIFRHDLRASDFQFYKGCTSKEKRIFSFVRDPVSRTLSAFQYLKSGGNNPLDAQDAYLLGIKCLSYKEFVETRLDYASTWQIHFLPQYKWIEAAEGIDLFRFEEFEAEYHRLCNLYNILPKPLQHHNLSDARSMKRPADSIQEKIKSLYEKDSRLFGY